MTVATSTELVPANGAAPPQPQFMTTFEGAGVAPFPEQVRAVLAKPVDPDVVEIKPDGIPYVPGVEWRRALTRAFGVGGWAIVPRTPSRIMGNIVTYHGALVCLGRFVAEAVGEAQYRPNNPNSSYATALEGAKTDAVGRCCKDLTLYSELWNPPWLETFKAKHCESYRGEKWVWDEELRKKVRKEVMLWRRKDHARRRPPDRLDLISGAGGRLPDDAPSAPASRPAATPAAAGAAPTAHDSTGGAASAAPPPTPGETPPPVDQGGTVVPPNAASQDTGEAAAADDYAAVAREMKRLQWKGQYAKIWLKDFFGVEKISALTAQQCASALALLVAVTTGKKPADCPAYTAMVSALQAKGAIG